MTTVLPSVNSNDAQSFKNSAREQWDRSAEGWNNHSSVVNTWLRQATDVMLEMAGIGQGMNVLDVAAGSGGQTLEIATRVGEQGKVLATDLSPAILALAQANALKAGLKNVETLVADGEALPVMPASFDAAVCRLGLMLFPNPLQSLHSIRGALRAGGGLCTMVFSRPERNPCLGILMSTALKHAGLPMRDPFQAGGLLSLGKPGRIDELFREAGFQNIASTVLDAPFQMPSARHYLEFVRTSASPIQQILSRLSAPAQDAAWAEMEQRLEAFNTSDSWVGPNELLLTAARH